MRHTAIFFLLLFMACSPKIQYLGDTHSPNTGKVDVYYDVGDIKKDFRIIGLLTGNTTTPLTNHFGMYKT